MKAKLQSATVKAGPATSLSPPADTSATISSTHGISFFPPINSAQEPSAQIPTDDAEHLDEAYHQQYPHLKTARTYTPWNIHLHPHHKHTSKTTPPTKTAQAMYYDPPALDAYRLYHTADPPDQLRNWYKHGEEILATEWDPRVCGWRWVMVDDATVDVSGGKKQGEKYIEEWTLTDVEKMLLDELGVKEDA